MLRITASPDATEAAEGSEAAGDARPGLNLPRPRRTRRPRADQLTILLPALLAAALCAIELGTRSLWLDEGATVGIASQHGAALWQGIAHDGGNMLAYYLLTHEVIAWFGDSATVIRLPSLIADAISAAIVAALALRLFADRRIALSAGALTAVSLPLIFWGQDARGYALMVALGAGSFLALTAILQTPAGARPARWAIVAYGLMVLTAVYVGFDSLLLAAAQLLLVLVAFRERARAVVGCLAVVAVLSMPLLVLALNRGSRQLFWVPRLGGTTLGQAALTLTSAGFSPNFNRTPTAIVAVAFTGALLVAAVVAAVTLIRRRSGRQALALIIPTSWLLVPAILALAAGLVGEPIELSRAAILLIPALALMIGWGLWHPRLPRGAGLAALAALLALRALQIAPTYGVSPENWRAATDYVLTATRADPACVAFYPEDGRTDFDYYLGNSPEAAVLTPVLPTTPWSQMRPYVEKYAPLRDPREVAARCPRLWLVTSHEGQPYGPPTSLRHYLRYLGLLTELSNLYGQPTLQHFGYSAQVHVYRFVRPFSSRPQAGADERADAHRHGQDSRP